MLGPHAHAASSSFCGNPSLHVFRSVKPTSFLLPHDILLCLSFIRASTTWQSLCLVSPLFLSHYSVSSLRSATTFCNFASPMCNTFSPITGTQKQFVDWSTDSAFICACHDWTQRVCLSQKGQVPLQQMTGKSQRFKAANAIPHSHYVSPMTKVKQEPSYVKKMDIRSTAFFNGV